LILTEIDLILIAFERTDRTGKTVNMFFREKGNEPE
jgi:hypothetical protein